MVTKDEMEFVAALAKLGQEDREIYRQIRAEAWALVQSNHTRKTPEQRESWKRNAS